MTHKLLIQLAAIQNILSISDFKGCGCSENQLYKLFDEKYKRNILEFYSSIDDEARSVILHIINQKLEINEK